MKVFDSHLHIVDPRFPLVPNQGFVPESFTCADYRERMHAYDLRGGAVVSGSFQAYDQTYLLDALARLGPGFVGVTQLPSNVSDDEILRLEAAGVRALRFNLRRGGSDDLKHLEPMARRVFDLVKWHVELYVDSRELDALAPRLTALPAVSIDHLGLSSEGLPLIVNLAAHGVRIKACGFGRVNFDVAQAVQQIHAANPAALMFGTDLPSTRAPRPFHDDDVQLIVAALGDKEAQRVLYDNAAAFYRLPNP